MVRGFASRIVKVVVSWTCDARWESDVNVVEEMGPLTSLRRDGETLLVDAMCGEGAGFASRL